MDHSLFCMQGGHGMGGDLKFEAQLCIESSIVQLEILLNLATTSIVDMKPCHQLHKLIAICALTSEEYRQ